MTRQQLLLFLSTFALGHVLVAASPASGESVDGFVRTEAGAPIEGARVLHVVDGGALAISDREGRFELEVAAFPAQLLITHPRYRNLDLEVPEPRAAPLEITLTPKQLVYEEVVVSASRGGEGVGAPESIAATLVETDDPVSPPATLAEMVVEVPGVSENGQGGIFQAYSVRGISRQRILTLVSGMRIVGERRAGVSASFLDPQLLGSVDVLRGPSSTYYGSGALGGVIQLFPRRYDRLTVDAGLRSEGDAAYGRVGWGDGRWSLGLAHRRAGDAETPDGERLNTGFEQTGLTLERGWTSGGRDWELDLLGSVGRDIGKSNTQFPERTTIYPAENHLLARLAVAGSAAWRFEVWAHANDLETRVTEGESLNVVDNEALDFGLNLQRESTLGGDTNARYGFDLFGRSGVSSIEVDTAPGTAPQTLRTLDGASETEGGLYGAVEHRFRGATVLAGARAAYQEQSNAGFRDADDSAVTGFFGLVAPIAGGVELVANAGTGLRFPSLSERFFSGTTGRGGVIGNPDLSAERSLSADLGLRWFGEKAYLSGYLFRNRIDDYIERIEIEPGLLTFVNLTEGTISGVELDGFYRPGAAWDLRFGAHAMDGEDAAGAPLADIPADRVHLGASRQSGRWGWNGKLEHRRSKTDPGSGEKAIPAVELLSLAASYRLRDGFELRLEGKNLFDERYFNSADRRTTLSPGRSIGLSLSWTAAP